jgi:hypothetical protein
MTKKTLSEAAAEILKASASGAPAQARQTLQGDQSGLGKGQDLGGDTPQRVAAENPDNVTGVSAKEPGPAPRVGSDPKKKLKSNNSGIDIDKQKQGTNSVTVDSYHKTKNPQLSSEQVEGDVNEDDVLYVDEEGNFCDAEGNKLDLTEEEIAEIEQALLGEEPELFVDEDGNVVHADGTPLTEEELAELESMLAENEDDENDSNEDGESLQEGEEAGEEEQVILFDREAMYETFKKELDQDLGSLLDSDESLSPEFKAKARTVFEAAVMARVDQMADTLESVFVETLAESVDEVKQELTEKTNDYLSYVAEEWLKENEVAIEKGLRTELTEDFINGLKSLFQEHFIDIPEDKINVVEELTDEVAEVESRLNEEISRNVELTKQVKQYKAAEIFATVCENLTDVQVDKMHSLVENLEFTTEDEFKDKLEMLRDNYCFINESAAPKTKSDGGLNEAVEIADEKKKTQNSDPLVNQFVSGLDRAASR